MNISNFQSFLHDIRDLYCHTRLSSTESIFIKLAQSFTEEFFRWIKSHEEIKDKLSDPMVYDTLVFLVSLRKKHPSMTLTLFAYLFTGTSNTMYLPYIFSFAEASNNTDIRTMLNPFMDILDLQKKFQPGSGGLNVLPDLIIIKNEFESYWIKKQEHPNIRTEKPINAIVEEKQKQNTNLESKNKRERVRKMVDRLFNRFTQDLSLIAKQNNKSELGEFLIAGGLKLPDATLRFFGVSAPTDAMLRVNKKLILDVMENNSVIYEQRNYNTILAESLHVARAVNPEEYAQYILTLEEQETSNILHNQNAIENVKINTSDKNLINPLFIIMLSHFFGMFYNQIR